MNKFKIVTAAACLTAFQAFAASGADQSVPPQSLPAWDQFTNDLRQLAPQMLARLPERLRQDPQTRQEIGRLMLAALAARTLEAVSADGDHPVFLPTVNVTLNVFQPNADTTYRTAYITQGGTYRLRGRFGSVRIFKLGQFGPNIPEIGKGAAALGYYDFNALKRDKDGGFDVVLSPTRPQGYQGDWWQLNPDAISLMVRQVAYDWPRERDPTLSIERLDIPAAKPRPSAAELEQKLTRLAQTTANSALFFVDHVEGLRREGFLNKLKEFDVSKMGGLAGQFYYEGAYELKPDEALIVEAKVPDKCLYSSIILTNDIYETIDWYNNHSSLNGSQYRVDRDGVVRFVVSARDPGVPNWLDTAGYASGAIQGRWTECSANPIPTVRKIALSEVRNALPADTPRVTPEQRDRIIRDRRAVLQQRPLW